jgi:hypothetical protein
MVVRIRTWGIEYIYLHEDFSSISSLVNVAAWWLWAVQLRKQGLSLSMDTVQTNSGTCTFSYPVGAGSSFLGKAANHSPPSDAEVKDELYLIRPC